MPNTIVIDISPRTLTPGMLSVQRMMDERPIYMGWRVVPKEQYYPEGAVRVVTPDSLRSWKVSMLGGTLTTSDIDRRMEDISAHCDVYKGGDRYLETGEFYITCLSEIEWHARIQQMSFDTIVFVGLKEEVIEPLMID